MKNGMLFTVLFLLCFAPIHAQQQANTEEAAIKKVIENETLYYYHGNYDKWAECVAHDPMTNFSWTSPFPGKDAVMELKGWDAVSTMYKKYMKENTPDKEYKPKNENYQFKISGNMAFVAYTEDGRSSQSRLLEKKDGQWRILRMEATASKAFKKFHQLYALQRMAGTWEVDLASYKEEGGGDWTLLGGTMTAKATDYGLSLNEHYDYRNAEGEYRASKDKGMMALNMGTGKIGVMFATVYPNSKWTRSAIGTGEIDDEGVLHIKGNMVGDENVGDVKYWLEGDDMNYAVVVKDSKGEQVYASSYTMKRKGVKSILP